ncbi:restriction endonuclease subunit S, partial [Selenomonas noxia]
MKYNLADIMDIIGGGTPKTNVEEYWDGEIPWLSVKDFNNDNRYVYRAEKTITKLGLENSSTKLLRYDDIIISARGTVGEVAMIPYPMAFNQSCYGLRAKDEIVDSTYLYYLIRYNIRELRRKSHGSVFDTITRDTFTNIEIDLPNMTIQRKVAIILKEIDDKIECNHAINKNLEEQARAIFKNWFIDLTPFSTDGSLPLGWRGSKVNEIVEFHDAKRIPLSNAMRVNMEKIYPYYGATSCMDYVDDYIFEGTYLLLGEDGTVIDKNGFPILQYVDGKFWVNNHAHILTGKTGFSVEWLYLM